MMKLFALTIVGVLAILPMAHAEIDHAEVKSSPPSPGLRCSPPNHMTGERYCCYFENGQFSNCSVHSG